MYQQIDYLSKELSIFEPKLVLDKKLRPRLLQLLPSNLENPEIRVLHVFPSGQHLIVAYVDKKDLDRETYYYAPKKCKGILWTPPPEAKFKEGDLVKITKPKDLKEFPNWLTVGMSSLDGSIEKITGRSYHEEHGCWAYRIGSHSVRESWCTLVVPKHVPWDFDNAPAMVKVKNRSGDKYNLILADTVGFQLFNSEGTPITITFKQALDHYTFLDGSPCGVLETKEQMEEATRVP